MEKSQIQADLLKQHRIFTDYLLKLSFAEYSSGTQNKWSPAEHLDHILLAVKPVRQIFQMPLFISSMLFGKMNRKGRTYNELVARYKNKLAAGGRATSRFVPKTPNVQQRHSKVLQLEKEVGKLVKKLGHYSDEELDKYVIPHPLLGKLSYREMSYFTLYHVQHHLELCKQYLYKENT